MSFLDMQDLATVAAQADLCRLLASWCADGEVLLWVVEGGVAAGLIGSLLRAR